MGDSMRPLNRLHLLLFLLVSFLSYAFATSGLADVQSAKVTGVVDGGTVTALLSDGRSIEVRLEGIDAPEHGQAFASASQQHLNSLVLDKNVNLDCSGVSYNRLVCKILDQIKAGMAWHYKQYQAPAEDAARRERIGLWADADPVQPQDFRHGTIESCIK
jgi:endonuclease YncB( thermonuclease family)